MPLSRAGWRRDGRLPLLRHGPPQGMLGGERRLRQVRVSPLPGDEGAEPACRGNFPARKGIDGEGGTCRRLPQLPSTHPCSLEGLPLVQEGNLGSGIEVLVGEVALGHLGGGGAFDPDNGGAYIADRQVAQPLTLFRDGGGMEVEAKRALCAYCRRPIRAGEKMVECLNCGALHHAPCWRRNGGCARKGCPLSPEAREVLPAGFGYLVKACPHCLSLIGPQYRTCPICDKGGGQEEPRPWWAEGRLPWPLRWRQPCWSPSWRCFFFPGHSALEVLATKVYALERR